MSCSCIYVGYYELAELTPKAKDWIFEQIDEIFEELNAIEEEDDKN